MTRYTNPYSDSKIFVQSVIEQQAFIDINNTYLINQLKNGKSAKGYLLFRKLPVIDSLPKTPNILPHQTTFDKLFDSEYYLALIGTLLGIPVGYQQEKNGAIFQNVFPTSINKYELSSESSEILLDFHTEIAFHPYLPDFLLLLCLRADHNKQAGTFLSHIDEILDIIPKQYIKTLWEPLFKTGIDPSFCNGKTIKGRGPTLSILYGDKKNPFLKYDYDLMVGLTQEAREALTHFYQAAKEVKKVIHLTPGDLLIIDNRKVIHGRTYFAPVFDGYDRWLQRMCVINKTMWKNMKEINNNNVITTQF